MQTTTTEGNDNNDDQPRNALRDRLLRAVAVALGTEKEALLPSAAAKRQLRRRRLDSREAYEERLQTFTVQNYFGKPSCLSPLICARFGWMNKPYHVSTTTAESKPMIGRDLLECEACHSCLVVDIPSHALLPESTCRLVEDYRMQILWKGHSPACIFHSKMNLLQSTKREAADTTSSNENAIIKSNNRIPIYMADVLPRDFMEIQETLAPKSALKVRTQDILKVFGLLKQQRDVPPIAEGEVGQLKRLAAKFWRGDGTDEGNGMAIPILQQLFDKEDLLATSTTMAEESQRLRSHSDAAKLSAAILALLGWQVSCNRWKTAIQMGCPVCGAHAFVECPLVGGDGGGGSTADAPTVSPTRAAATTPQGIISNTKRFKRTQMEPIRFHRHYCPIVAGFPTKYMEESEPLFHGPLQRLLKQTSSSSAGEEAEGETVAQLDPQRSFQSIRMALKRALSNRKPIVTTEWPVGLENDENRAKKRRRLSTTTD